MRIPVNKLIILSVAIMLATVENSTAQLSLNAQLRARTEFRDGQGAPLSKGLKPALFTSQRTRFNVLFNSYRLKMGVSVQDVRVWGQDVSTINRTTTQDNNGLMLHEAWAQIQLTDTINKQQSLNLKIGRQELIYDDQRLIGNLDWLQQARRHDALVLKYETKNWMVHFGAAFNQNKEKASGTVYNSIPPGNYTATTNGGTMYKSMEYLYAAKKLNEGKVSFLIFSDQFNTYSLDSANIKTFTNGSWSRATTGFYVEKKIKALSINASAYYQFGKTAVGKDCNGGTMLTLNTQYSFGKFSMGPGIDYTCPDFDPLYGTPHKFWGAMDYYYAGSGFGNHGLIDYFLKSKWKASDKFTLNADVHHFTASSSIQGYNKEYGQEVDIVGLYRITKQIDLECGFAHYFSTNTLVSPTVKNIPNARNSANWAYVMINIKPEFLFKQ